MENSAQSICKKYKEELEKEFNDLFIVLEQDDFISKDLLKSLKYSVLDAGKRIRPILSLLTAEAIIQANENSQAIAIQTNPALGLALAIELVHCGSLIHDDLPCMDDDELRRGKASNHIKFNEATALLAGDFLMVYPIELFISKTQNILQNYYSKENQIDHKQVMLLSVQKLSSAINKMIIGQSLDMEFSSSNDELPINKIEQMQKYKTGALLEASIEIAAILAGANNKQIKALKVFAQNIGLAFQITDDILDCISNTETLGKTTGKDLEQNKFTYVKHFGLEKSKVIAQDLIQEAISEIETIGISPAKLSLIAQYVILRTN